MLIVNDGDRAAAYDIVEVVVLRVDVGPRPPQAQNNLSWGERVAVDLPDREVWVTSTRSRTAAVCDAR
jgi:hypothetical protein